MRGLLCAVARTEDTVYPRLRILTKSADPCLSQLDPLPPVSYSHGVSWGHEWFYTPEVTLDNPLWLLCELEVTQVTPVFLMTHQSQATKVVLPSPHWSLGYIVIISLDDLGTRTELLILVMDWDTLEKLQLVGKEDPGHSCT